MSLLDLMADMIADRYFGRARDLPGVKELFEAAAAKSKAKVTDKPLEERDDLRRQVDAAYYGYSPDEEDATLLAYEAAKEKEAFDNLASSGSRDALPPGWEPLPGDEGDGKAWDLPTVAEVQRELLDRRKRKILDQL